MPRKKKSDEIPEIIETASTNETNQADQQTPASKKAKTRKKDKQYISESPPKKTPKPKEKPSFFELDFRKLDKDLSPDEQKEWNAIYASYRAESVLTGRVSGVDTIKVGEENISCLIVFDYRVKVLIPYNEIWVGDSSGEEKPDHVLRGFLGAEIDYIVRNIDREGCCVVASRALAMQRRRKSFAKRKPKIGDLVDCRIMVASSTRLLVEHGGYECTLSQREISYGSILDLREDYKPGQRVKAVFKGLKENGIALSIKEVNPHPFDGIEARHPLHCRRVSRIMGKYAGGVFCELEKGFTCMCLYSPEQQDSDFDLGDDVIIAVTRYDYNNKLVYGRIVTNW